MGTPIVAVATDTRQFEGYDWHATPHQYLAAALEGAGVIPLMVPSFGEKLDITSILDRIDGVLITGSKTNVHPSRYGVEETEAHGPFDPMRDATTLPLIRETIDRGVPLLAICRGIQELNVALCGTLANEIQSLPGRIDHRLTDSDDPDIKFEIRQKVRIDPDSCIGRVLGEREITVNSLHRQAIDAVSPRLLVEAVAEDGTIEAVSVADAPGFAVGVQWHPEYWFRTDKPSGRIFQAFGDAVRAYADRQASRLAAE